MTLKRRIGKIEQEISPPERRKITVRLSCAGDPEPEYPPGAIVLKVRLGAPEQNDAP